MAEQICDKGSKHLHVRSGNESSPAVNLTRPPGFDGSVSHSGNVVTTYQSSDVFSTMSTLTPSSSDRSPGSCAQHQQKVTEGRVATYITGVFIQRLGPLAFRLWLRDLGTRRRGRWRRSTRCMRCSRTRPVWWRRESGCPSREGRGRRRSDLRRRRRLVCGGVTQRREHSLPRRNVYVSKFLRGVNEAIDSWMISCSPFVLSVY